jgi:hypothetical protein
MSTKQAGAAFAAMIVLAGTAYGQTSTTTTTSKTTTTTTTKSWKSPDGNKGGSSSVTNTNTKSKSVTVGRPGPASHTVSRPNPDSRPTQYDYGPTGSWTLAAGKDRPCSLSLYKGFNAEGGGATTSGCTSADLKAVGNWMLQNGGRTLILTKSLVVPVATLRLVGPGRFQGTGSNGQTITVWR